ADYRMNAMQRMVFRSIRPHLRRLDVEAARSIDHFISNSAFVRARIQRYYGRDAVVIYPPVNTRFFTPSNEDRRADFYLAAGALVSYERVDVVVEAFNQMGSSLIVAGDGPELKALRRMAGPTIEFRGWVSDTELRDLYRNARAFVFAAREDFGLMP